METKREMLINGSKPLKSKFGRIKNLAITDYNAEMEVDGKILTENIGTFTGTKFPETSQGIMPEFIGKLGKFSIKKEGGEYWDQTDLDKLVNEVPLNYEGYHKFVGERIKSASIVDYSDPYLCHSQWRVLLQEGISRKDLDHPTEKYIGDILRGKSNIQEENVAGIQSSSVDYVIRRPELAEKRDEDIREDKLSIAKLWATIEDNDKKMLSLLRLFGNDPDDQLSRSKLKSALWKYADDAVTTDRGQTYQKMFIKYVTMPDKDRELREVVMLGWRRGKIEQRAGLYEFRGASLGESYDEMVAHFDKIENKAQFDALKGMLEKKVNDLSVNDPS